MTLASLDGYAESLSLALDGRGKVRVPLNELLVAWDQAVPELRGRADQLSELSSALKAMSSIGRIALPGSPVVGSQYPPSPASFRHGPGGQG